MNCFTIYKTKKLNISHHLHPRKNLYHRKVRRLRSMERQPPSTTEQTNRIYEDFDPSITWARDASFDTLSVHLPGFRREQLKVQVTSSRKLRIAGERPLGNNRWSRFSKEIPIPSNYEPNEITAKFENATLSVKYPKLIAPAQPKPPASTEESNPQIPDSQAQNARQEQATQRLPSNTPAMEKQKSANNASQKHKQDPQPPMKTLEQQLASQQVPRNTNMDRKEQRVIKQMNGASGPDDAKTVPRKSTLENKDEGENITDDARTVSPKSTVEKKNKGLDHEGGENITDNAAMEGKRDVGGVTASNDEAAETSCGGEKSRVVEDFKQRLGVLIREMKHSRKLMNLVVALLVVLFAVHYARHAIRSIGKSDD